MKAPSAYSKRLRAKRLEAAAAPFTKACGLCQRELRYTKFDVWPNRLDNLAGICRECSRLVG